MIEAGIRSADEEVSRTHNGNGRLWRGGGAQKAK